MYSKSSQQVLVHSDVEEDHPDLPADIIYDIGSAMADMGISLDALTRTSMGIRQLCLCHHFRRLQYVTADDTVPSLEEYCEKLDKIAHLHHHVRELALVPAADDPWEDTAVTEVSLCTLLAVVKKFPRLRSLDIECVTWKLCTKAHDCLEGAHPREFTRITMYNVRVLGGQDPSTVLRLASSVNYLVMQHILPMAPIVVTDTALIADVAPSRMDVQLALDSYNNVDGQRYVFHNSHAVLAPAIQASKTLTELRVMWSLSHRSRAPFVANPLFDFDLKQCTALRTVFFSVPANRFSHVPLQALILTVTSLPSSTVNLVVEVDVAFRKYRGNIVRHFDNDHGYWPLLWHMVALNKHLRHITIQTCRDPHSIGGFPLMESNATWETNLLNNAAEKLREMNYRGRVTLRRKL